MGDEPATNELSAACAHAMIEHPPAQRAVVSLVAEYHQVTPLVPDDLAALPDLIRAHLAVHAAAGDANAAAALVRHGAGPPELEVLRLRSACGYEPVATALAVRDHLHAHAAGPVFATPLHAAPFVDITDVEANRSVRTPAVGRYLEVREVYDTAAFDTEEGDERRTVHLGVDLFLPVGEAVLAPLDGIVGAVAFRPARCDWGGIVVLEHLTPEGVRFHTLYGHLSRAVVERWRPGDAITRGATVGHIGTSDENGGWVPHLHLQLLTTDLGRGDDVHGVGTMSELELWESVNPDPNLLLRLPHSIRAG